MQQFPDRPGYCETGNAITILANFYRFNMRPNYNLYKFDISFEPEVPDEEAKLRETLVRKCRNRILEELGKYIFARTSIYVAMDFQPEEPLVVEVEHNNQNYTITFTPVEQVTGSDQMRTFYNTFFNTIQARLGLIRIGRRFYDPRRTEPLNGHGLNVWPGYINSVRDFEGGCYVNIDITSRCLRQNNVLQQIEDRLSAGGREAAERSIVGNMVWTVYNYNHYKVEEIMWDMTPESHRFQKNQEMWSLMRYYHERYNKQIQNPEQPLLRAQVDENDVYLIPELCIQTGLTDEIRSNFNIMRSLAQKTKLQPQERLNKSGELLKNLRTNQKSKEEIDAWHAIIEEEPAKLNARVLPAGSIKMRGPNEQEPTRVIPINETNGGFDREVQNPMFLSGGLNKWGILYCRNDERDASNFGRMLISEIGTFRIPHQPPRRFSIQDANWNTWDAELRNICSPDVDILVCLLPGKKGNCRLYDQLKRLTFSTLPVPTQVVLTSTIRKDQRALGSIITKIVIQINAKIQGVPWALDDMPFRDIPTMIVGVDVFHKRNSFSVLGVCATSDRDFSHYISVPMVNRPGEEVSARLSDAFCEAIKQFKRHNGIGPRRVIVFRDGVSDSQRNVVLNAEVPQIKRAFERLLEEEIIPEKPLLTALVVNKRINARFYQPRSNGLSNPPIGTCVDRLLVDPQKFDFYLCPTRATQGVMNPTHYFVVIDENGFTADDLQVLSYRMCYGYYNWSGSIRVPAPIMYAHKLAYQYGERSVANNPLNPHGHWVNTRSLYFI